MECEMAITHFSSYLRWKITSIVDHFKMNWETNFIEFEFICMATPIWILIRIQSWQRQIEFICVRCLKEFYISFRIVDVFGSVCTHICLHCEIRIRHLVSVCRINFQCNNYAKKTTINVLLFSLKFQWNLNWSVVDKI